MNYIPATDWCEEFACTEIQTISIQVVPIQPLEREIRVLRIRVALRLIYDWTLQRQFRKKAELPFAFPVYEKTQVVDGKSRGGVPDVFEGGGDVTA